MKLRAAAMPCRSAASFPECRRRRTSGPSRKSSRSDALPLSEEHAELGLIEPGDIVCCYTGYADKLLELGDDVPADLPRAYCPAFDGRDEKLLQWIDEWGMAVLVSDNRAVEFEHTGLPDGVARGPGLAIHELCLFKLCIHLGKM